MNQALSTVLGVFRTLRDNIAVRICFYVFLAILSFALALQATFPYGRVKDRIADELSKNYDVVIGGVERGIWPGKMMLTNVSLKTRPTQPNQVPTLFYIKRLTLDLHLLPILNGKVALDIEALIGNGTIDGEVTLAKDRVQLAFHSDGVPGAGLPLREAVGLPVLGKIAFDMKFESPLVRNTVDWTRVTSHVQLECPTGCTVGDGKTKLRPVVKRQNQAEFVKDGIEFNKINIDKLVARFEVKKGVAKVSKFDVASKDGELKVDFEAKLEKQLNDSQVTGCLRYKPSEELEKRDYRTALQLKTTGAPLGPDKLFHIKLQGQIREIKRLGVVCPQYADEPSRSETSGAAPPPPPVVEPPPAPIPAPEPPAAQPPPPPAEVPAGAPPPAPPVGEAPATPGAPPPPAVPPTTPQAPGVIE